MHFCFVCLDVSCVFVNYLLIAAGCVQQIAGMQRSDVLSGPSVCLVTAKNSIRAEKPTVSVARG